MTSHDSEKTITRLINTIEVYKQLLKDKNQIIGAVKRISPDILVKAKLIVDAKRTKNANVKKKPIKQIMPYNISLTELDNTHGINEIYKNEERAEYFSTP